MKKIDKDFNVVTGKETITEREETNAEKNERLEVEKEIATNKAEAEANAIAKSALLDRLGITADEAKLLIG
jgi:hypothetical protein